MTRSASSNDLVMIKSQNVRWALMQNKLRCEQDKQFTYKRNIEAR